MTGNHFHHVARLDGVVTSTSSRWVGCPDGLPFGCPARGGWWMSFRDSVVLMADNDAAGTRGVSARWHKGQMRHGFVPEGSERRF